MTTDRRSFLSGALAGALLPQFVRPQRTDASVEARPQTIRRGRALGVSPRDRRLVVAHDQRRTIAVGPKLVEVGGQPLELAVSPDGRLVAVTTAFWDEPGLAIVDLRRAVVLKRLEVGPAPFGVAFSADGDRVVVSGGEQEGEVWIVDARRFAVLAHRPVGTVPRAVAAVLGRDAAWVALSGLDRVVRVSTRTGRIERTLETPALPDRVAVSPDGGRLLVSHGGLAAEHVSEIDIATRRLRRHRAGRLPSAVAWTRSGRRLVALGGAGEVLVIGGKRHRVGGAPRGLAVAGNRAWTVDALSGAIAQVRA